MFVSVFCFLRLYFGAKSLIDRRKRCSHRHFFFCGGDAGDAKTRAVTVPSRMGRCLLFVVVVVEDGSGVKIAVFSWFFQ